MQAVAPQGVFDQLQRLGCVTAAGRQPGQLKIGRGLPGRAPGRLVEGVLSFRITALHFESQAQDVVRLAIVGVWVAADEAGDGLPKIGLGLRKFAAVKQQPPQGIVAAAIVGVAAQRLSVIRFGRKGRVPILLQVQAVQEQLFIRGNFGRRPGRGGR